MVEVLRSFAGLSVGNRTNCKLCKSALGGDIQLVFKEKGRSNPAEETGSEKIKSRIAEMINRTTDQISADNSGCNHRIESNIDKRWSTRH